MATDSKNETSKSSEKKLLGWIEEPAFLDVVEFPSNPTHGTSDKPQTEARGFGGGGFDNRSPEEVALGRPNEISSIPGAYSQSHLVQALVADLRKNGYKILR